MEAFNEEWVNSQNYRGEGHTLYNHSIASMFSELTHSSSEASISYILSWWSLAYGKKAMLYIFYNAD